MGEGWGKGFAPGVHLPPGEAVGMLIVEMGWAIGAGWSPRRVDDPPKAALAWVGAGTAVKAGEEYRSCRGGAL